MSFFDRLMGNKQAADAGREAYNAQMGVAGGIGAAGQRAIGRVDDYAELASANEADIAGGLGRQIMDTAPRMRGDAGVNTQAIQANALGNLAADRAKNVRTAEQNEAKLKNEYDIGATQAAGDVTMNAAAQNAGVKMGRVTPFQALAGGFKGVMSGIGALKGGG